MTQYETVLNDLCQKHAGVGDRTKAKAALAEKGLVIQTSIRHLSKTVTVLKGDEVVETVVIPYSG